MEKGEGRSLFLPTIERESEGVPLIFSILSCSFSCSHRPVGRSSIELGCRNGKTDM